MIPKEILKQQTLDITVYHKKINNEILGICSLQLMNIFVEFEKSNCNEIIKWYELNIDSSK